MHVYRFTGTEPEDFPAPPIARRLDPGDLVEIEEPVVHVRLQEVTGTAHAGAEVAETPEPHNAADEPPARPKE